LVIHEMDPESTQASGIRETSKSVKKIVTGIKGGKESLRVNGHQKDKSWQVYLSPPQRVTQENAELGGSTWRP